MKKTLALSVLFIFTLAITSPSMAVTFDQEPVKKEQTADKKKGECNKECDKKCSDKKACSEKKACCSDKKQKKG